MKRLTCMLTIAVLLLAGSVCLGCTAGNRGSVATGDLPWARSGHVSLLLGNGSAVVVGDNDEALDVCYYVPATGFWYNRSYPNQIWKGPSTSVVMNATWVLTLSGVGDDIWLYDLENVTMQHGQMTPMGGKQEMIMLSNGSLFIAGLSDSEFFMIPSGMQTDLADITTILDAGPFEDELNVRGDYRRKHTVVELQNGSAMVIGGHDSALLGNNSNATGSCLVYGGDTMNPVDDLIQSRWDHESVVLDDGKVLVAGGRNKTQVFPIAELYDPVAESWSLTGNLNEARTGFTMHKLSDGTVAAIGGTSTIDGSVLTSQIEVFDPAGGMWTQVDILLTNRYDHSSVMLQDGSILVSGGIDGAGVLASTEIVFGPAPVLTNLTLNFEAELFGVEAMGDLPVTVQVVNDTGVAVVGADVKLYAPEGSVAFTRAVTDVEGKVSFTFSAPDNMGNTFLAPMVWVEASAAGFNTLNQSLTVNVAPHPTAANGTYDNTVTHWKLEWVNINSSRDYFIEYEFDLVDQDAALDVYGRSYSGLYRYDVTYGLKEVYHDSQDENRTEYMNISGSEYVSNTEYGVVYRDLAGPTNTFTDNASGQFWENRSLFYEQLFFGVEPRYDTHWIKTDGEVLIEFGQYEEKRYLGTSGWSNNTDYTTRDNYFQFYKQFEYKFWMGTYTVWWVNTSQQDMDYILWCPELGTHVLWADYNEFDELQGYRFLTEYNTQSGEWKEDAIEIVVQADADTIHAGEEVELTATVVDQWNETMEGADVSFVFNANEENISAITPATIKTNSSGLATFILTTNGSLDLGNETVVDIDFTATLGGLEATANSLITVKQPLPEMDVTITFAPMDVHGDETVTFSVEVMGVNTSINGAVVTITLTNAEELNITEWTGYGTTANGTFTIEYTTPELTEDIQLNFTALVTKTGYKDYEKDFIMTVFKPEPEVVVTVPIILDMGNGVSVTVKGGIIGDARFTVESKAIPEGAESMGTIDIFFDVSFKGTGSYNWVSIEVFYNESVLPDNVDEENLKIYYWDGSKWMEAENTTAYVFANVVSANVTHLTTFAPIDITATSGDDDIVIDPEDADADGLRDSWEMDNFGNLDQTANGDYDNDGHTNLDEFVAGTDPTDEKDYPGKKDDKEDYTMTIIVILVIVFLLLVAVIGFVFLKRRMPEEEEGEELEEDREEEEFECPECGALLGEDDEECPDCGEEIVRLDEDDEE